MGKSKLSKIVIAGIGAIILGAIGSGLWEEIVKPLLGYLTTLIVEISTKMSDGYLDSLYESVGVADKSVFSQYLYTLFSSAFMALPIVIFYLLLKIMDRVGKRAKDEHTDSTKDPIEHAGSGLHSYIFEAEDKTRNFKIAKYSTLALMIPLLVMSTLTSSSTLFSVIYNHSTTIYVEQSLDIVSPYITDQNLKELISEYRLIDNKGKFLALNAKLIQIAESNSITLPEKEIY